MGEDTFIIFGPGEHGGWLCVFMVKYGLTGKLKIKTYW